MMSQLPVWAVLLITYVFIIWVIRGSIRDVFEVLRGTELERRCEETEETANILDARGRTLRLREH